MFPSLDSICTHTQSVINLSNTSCTLSDSCVIRTSLPFRISTVAIQGACRPTSQNKGYSQRWSLALSSPQSPSTLRWEKVSFEFHCNEYSMQPCYHHTHCRFILLTEFICLFVRMKMSSQISLLEGLSNAAPNQSLLQAWHTRNLNCPKTW